MHHPKLDPARYLPMTPEHVAARGWDAVDVVFVTGDAYVDHPSFAMALLGRLLESEGYRVAMLSQPDWRSCEPWRQFGRPRLCFAISAGNMDSMVNHYTANRKVRNDDAYSPGGEIGRRPDRATAVYCQRAREAFKGVPIIAGGVEASLRRLAHYDYWSDKVRRSVVMDSKADLVVFGMGERTMLEIVRRLAAGQSVEPLRELRGVAYRLGRNAWSRLRERWSAHPETGWGEGGPTNEVRPEAFPATDTSMTCPADWPTIELPSYEEVAADRRKFAAMTRIAHLETNPYSARRLVQPHGPEAVVVNPPAMPLSEAEMDRVYGLPYQRSPHPDYRGRTIPAFDVVKDSIQIVRGCFGGCTFCSITAHEGRIIQSRSPRSIRDEIRRMVQDPEFKGVVSDLGGPTANMYRMNCTRPAVRAKCRRLSCVHPTICKLLNTDHGPLVELMREARQARGVKKVFIASGVRMDLARRNEVYMNELVRHHVGGHLKVAPEHADPEVLRLMKKPSIDDFEAFARMFSRISAAAGKKQYLVPYFIAGHPGCGLNEMIRLAEFLKRTGYRPEQVQDFYPTPFDIATCMYHTGIDPMTGQEVEVAKGARQRRLQRALLQFFLPERYPEVREALIEAGRQDLIGDGPECLIPARPPRGANTPTRAPRPRPDAPGAVGYRPHRKTSRRRDRR
jgi:uncharacterized radical SAM protein YgiQ